MVVVVVVATECGGCACACACACGCDVTVQWCRCIAEQVVIGRDGGITRIFRAMAEFPTVLSLNERAVSALYNLVSCPANHAVMVDANGVLRLMQAVMLHDDAITIVERAFTTLCHLVKARDGLPLLPCGGTPLSYWCRVFTTARRVCPRICRPCFVADRGLCHVLV